MDRLKTTKGKNRSKYGLITGSALLGVVIALTVLIRYWPFTEDKVRSELAAGTSSEVQIGKFHRRYFPPGCVAENVVFHHGNSGTPLMVVGRLTVESTLLGLLEHRVSLLRAEGLQGMLELKGFRRNTSGHKVIIDELVADGAVLEIPRRSFQEKRQFLFHRFSVTNLNGGGVMSFHAVLENPLPRGILRASGQLGPWSQPNPAATGISGEYSLEQADLGAFRFIAGNISSIGTFHGTFERIGVAGQTHSPAFVVAKTGHGLPLDADFKAEIDATNGNVILQEVKARFGADYIAGRGTIARRDDGKRSAILDLICSRGRIEDTFYPFIHSPKSPIMGDVEFQMHVVIPSGHRRFIRRIDLTSTFKIQNAQFIEPETQNRLSKISAPPNQQQTHELADFVGNVRLSDGVAKFSQLSIHDEDADASFRGDYDLTDQRLNLHGKLKTAASLTKTTQGIKAVFAKVIEPFFKKRPHETVVPVHIGGTYSRPSFGLDLGG